MPEQSILIVDDAKFSAALVAKRLTNAGFTDVRTANHPNDAIDLLKNRACDLLIADWIMPDMDGIELCQNIREIDSDHHFTYCLLITAKDGNESLNHALANGMDDFILKSELNQQLIPRVKAGLRTSATLNNAQNRNVAMQQEINKLLALKGRDEATGLGNTAHACDAVTRVQKHADARGGATSYMTLQIRNWDQIANEYRNVVCKELGSQVAKKLRSLVRPLDEVCRLTQDEFAVIAHFKDSNDCNLSTYRRIHQGLDKQAFKTSAGFISVSVACAICFIDSGAQTAELEQLIQFNHTQIRNCETRQTIAVSPWELTA